ncbi:MAG: DUF934 domain-containing protein [Rhodospirillales bacterium]
MTTLLKNGTPVKDPWTAVRDDEPVPAGAHPLVSLARWRSDRAALTASGAPLAVRLEPGEHPGAIADDAHMFAMIALVFPSFTDGRAYSYARILRERLGFQGELRAQGDVLRDQFLFMRRCGFDALEVKKDADAAAWAEAVSAVSAAYQPALDSGGTGALRAPRGRTAPAAAVAAAAAAAVAA